MRSIPQLLLCLTTCLVAVGFAAPTAQAAVVTGTVAKSAGYRVALVRTTGVAQYRTLNATGSFRFSGTSTQLKGATLHLVRANGRYYGPIVLSSGSSRAYMQLSGVRGSLGTITRRVGHAKALRAARATIDFTKVAAANRLGVPVGANRLGFVKRFKFKSGASGRGVSTLALTGPDADLDGVANVFDVDDDGDLTLDAVDAESTDGTGLRVWFYSVLNAQVQDSINVNMGSVTPDAINPLLREWQGLTFSLLGSATETNRVTAVNVDCFQLAYCRRGSGTGVMIDPPAGFQWGDPWLDHDPDSNGLPNMWKRTNEWFASVWTRADLNTLHVGDVFRWDIRRGTSVESRTATLNYFFVTTPALKSHAAGGVTSTVAYPVADDGVGTFANPMPVGGTTLALQVWRPQRPAIPGAETGAYRDQGGLFWGIELEPAGTSEHIECAQSHFTNLSPTLEFRRDLPSGLFLHDTAADMVPDQARTIGFTVDLAACLTAAGRPATGTYGLSFRATDRDSNSSVQRITIQLP